MENKNDNIDENLQSILIEKLCEGKDLTKIFTEKELNMIFTDKKLQKLFAYQKVRDDLKNENLKDKFTEKELNKINNEQKLRQLANDFDNQISNIYAIIDTLIDLQGPSFSYTDTFLRIVLKECSEFQQLISEMHKIVGV